MLFPKYNIEFFTSKITDLGKKPAGRVRNILISKFNLGLYEQIKKNLQRRRKLGCALQ